MKIISANNGNDLIKSKIVNGDAFIATKMGAVEQTVLVCNGCFTKQIRDMASNNAGITPSDDYTLKFFIDAYVSALKNTDIIGSMGISEEEIIPKYCPNAIVSELRYLEPFYFENPWSEFLYNKNVLVIHPFEKSIMKQYNNRELLFANSKVLPKFNLKTIKAEQTNGGGKHDSKPFIQSLEIMKQKMDAIDFDIAIIGCGAYGLLLSNYVKAKGKQAIHIGGGLQIMFGIKGKRWDVHSEIKKLYNDNWCRPYDEEKTDSYQVVEGGTYW
jgi:hypothetical protein